MVEPMESKTIKVSTKIQKEQDALFYIIIEYLKVASLEFKHIKWVFNRVSNHIYRTEEP